MSCSPVETLKFNSSEEFTILRLDSANGPVYRRVKKTPLRDARLDEIPTIDISGIYNPSLSERQAVADQVNKAATTNGFFYIKNHGVPRAVIEAARMSATEFFHQPDDTKQRANIKLTSAFNGWKPPRTQRINRSESIDSRQAFSVRYNPKYDPQAPLDLDDIPPEILKCLTTDDWCWNQTSNLPHFKADVLNYWQRCLGLARVLIHSFALALSLPEDYFDAKTSFPDANVAINFYPAEPPVPEGLEEQVGIGSHTDFQLFTILWQDPSGGLQVLNKEGEWLNAPPIPDTFVVNIGDFLQRITNDRYISTVHRVKNISGKERISMPVFFGFNLNESCGVVPSCVDEECPAKYEEISCKEWVELRVRAMHETN